MVVSGGLLVPDEISQDPGSRVGGRLRGCIANVPVRFFSLAILQLTSPGTWECMTFFMTLMGRTMVNRTKAIINGRFIDEGTLESR